MFNSVGDPVTSGLVGNLARPGGNVTGLSNLAPELVGKRLELLKQAVPAIRRVAVLWQPGGGGGERTDKDMRREQTTRHGRSGCSSNSLRREIPPISTGPSRT